MSSTSQVTTFEDLYLELGQRLRLTTSINTTLEQLKRAINVAHADIHNGNDYRFPWCERTTYLRTKAPYTTGTVSATVGSGSLIGSGTLWNSNDSFGVKNVVSKGKVIVEGTPDIYKVNLVTSDTVISFYTNYINENGNVSNAAYTYFEDEYSLSSSFLRLVDLQQFSPDMGIALIPRHEFRRRFPANRVSGRPRFACIIDTETSGSNLTPVRRVVFYPYPDKEYIIPYTFITGNIAISAAGAGLTSMSAVDDAPIMPLRYRHAIVYHALYHWYRDKKDDARSQDAKTEYTDLMTRLINDQEIASHTQTRLVPATSSYIRASKRPYSYRVGRRVHDLNDEFDSFKR